MNNLIYYVVIPFSLLACLFFSTLSVAGIKAEVSNQSDIKKFEPPITPIDKQIVLEAKTGIMHYQYTDPFYQTLSDNIPFIAGGLTLNLGNFSVNVLAQHADKGTDGFFQKIENVEINRNTDVHFYRNDYAVTLDYQISPISQLLENLIDTKHRFSIFGGWKWSNTNVNAINISLETGELNRDEITFETSGPFIGIADSLALDSKNNHWLGMSIVGGQIEGNYNFSTLEGENRIADVNAIEPTFVLRYGLSVKGLLLNLFIDNQPIGQLTYALSLDHFNYSMDLEGSDLSRLDRPFVEETMDSFNASLNWVFYF